jgi:Fe-S cluster assembly protein SufD
MEHTEIGAAFKSTVLGSRYINNSHRTLALQRLDVLQFPTRKTESWKYTRPSRLLNKKFDPASVLSGVNPVADNDAHVLVFSNSLFQKQYSDISLPEGVSLTLNQGQTLSDSEGYTYGEGDVFLALNHAAPSVIISFKVSEGVRLTKPVRIICFVGNSVLFQPLVFIEVGMNSEATVSVEFRNASSNACVNASVDALLHPKSKLNYDRVQYAGSEDSFIVHERITQYESSVFNMHSVSLGGEMIRNRTEVKSAEKNTDTILNGVFVPNSQSHIDNSTVMDHMAPDCISSELYKGIGLDKGMGVFNGKVFVRQDAQRINAYQRNANLLLSEQAGIYSKPELEIYADDVKCSHGSTTGQLPANQVFYLKARGIGQKEAEKLLVNAFTAEVTSGISNALLREEADGAIAAAVATANE